MHVGLNAVHDFLQVLNAVRINAIGLHGVVDAMLDAVSAIQAQRFERISIRRHALGLGIQFGDGKENVDIGLAQVRLDGFDVRIDP